MLRGVLMLVLLLTGFFLAVRLLALPSVSMATQFDRGVLLADSFDDPEAGQIPRGSTPEGDTADYENGEYVLRLADPTQSGGMRVTVTRTLFNSVLAVDARVVGTVDEPGDGMGISLGCREGADPSTRQGYLATVFPQRGLLSLLRWDSAEDWVPLTLVIPWRDIARGDASNHIEFTCDDDRISVEVNGVMLLSVRDATYAYGTLSLGLRQSSGQAGPGEVRFDNLEVRDPRGGLRPPSMSPVPASPTPATGEVRVPAEELP